MEGLVVDMGHLILPVKDMARALAFYRDPLGFKVVGSVDPVWTVLSVPAGQITLWRTDDIPVVATGADREGTPFNFHVRDFGKAAALLESEGVRVKRDGPHSGVVWDPFGNALGLHDHREKRG